MSRFGVAGLGAVQEAGGELVRTRFVCFLVPLVPLGSEYVRGDLQQPKKIPLNQQSVFLGYLRSYLGLVSLIAAIALPMVAFYWLEADGTPGYVAPALGTFVVFSTFWLMAMRAGRCSEAERRARHILKVTTGIGAFPSMLFSDDADRYHARLQAKWDSNKQGRDWRKRFTAGSLAGLELPLLFSLALYEAATKPSEDANRRARIAWEMVHDHWQFDQAEL